MVDLSATERETDSRLVTGVEREVQPDLYVEPAEVGAAAGADEDDGLDDVAALEEGDGAADEVVAMTLDEVVGNADEVVEAAFVELELETMTALLDGELVA